jgi:hypothetical protein
MKSTTEVSVSLNREVLITAMLQVLREDLKSIRNGDIIISADDETEMDSALRRVIRWYEST